MLNAAVAIARAETDDSTTLFDRLYVQLPQYLETGDPAITRAVLECIAVITKPHPRTATSCRSSRCHRFLPGRPDVELHKESGFFALST
jgi:hypothetical protein